MSVVIARVRDAGGEAAVGELLRRAGSERSVEYLLDVSNWVSYDEALALLAAGAEVTQHPWFANAVGTDAAKRLNASPVAALLRSLGTPEAVYERIAETAAKYSVATTLTAAAVGPGEAHVVAHAVDPFPRSADHCAMTCGLLSQVPILFGLRPATVTHERCAALGAPECRYDVTWDPAPVPVTGGVIEAETSLLREQLDAAQRRLSAVFATAGDLIAADEMEDALARITDRAAGEVRAQRYLLAVRLEENGELLCHHRGFEPGEAEACAERAIDAHPASWPENWLVVPVRSGRRDYGRLLAMYEPGSRFFAQERELLSVYATYAASVLDSATALLDATRRYEQSTALLSLARALAVAGTSHEVARKLCEAVPAVVDCDRVGVYLWDSALGELVRAAVGGSVPAELDMPSVRADDTEWRWAPAPGGLLERLVADPRPDPVFIDADSGDALARALFADLGAVATILVPLVTGESMLGLIAVSIMHEHARLAPSADLFDRLSGLAAQATTALQNGRLVDEITHRALHDDLTGLANRLQFSDRLRRAIGGEGDEAVGVVFLDLDGFKPINDEFGHDTGDQLLVAVAERLRGAPAPRTSSPASAATSSRSSSPLPNRSTPRPRCAPGSKAPLRARFSSTVAS